MIKPFKGKNPNLEKFFIPRSVQQSIPIRRIYSDGIWQVGRKHSRTWRFADVNYAAASEEERRSIFLSYGAVLNALPTDAAAKITIVNRRLDPEAFRRNILMRERGDTLDKYRREANEILVRRAAESNNLVQEKYITLSIVQRRIEESRAYFRRVDGNLSKSFGRLDSGAHLLSNHDRLRILHDFFRPGEEQYFTFDQTACIRRGMDFRDLICPDGMTFKAGHFEMGEKVGRVLFLKDYASYIKDDMISDLSDLSRSLMLSIDILPIPTDEAVRDVQNQIMGIETDITRWQQRQNDRNNFTASVPYELEQLRGETKEFLSDLTERDQRMIFAVVTLVHIADSLEQLDADTLFLLEAAALTHDIGIREAERGMVFDTFSSKEHEILTGTVSRIDPRSGNVYLRIGTGNEATEGILSLNEQVSTETYTEGQLLKVYLVEVRRGTRGPQVMVSRTHPGLVKRLFELEVPEIFDGTVEIRSIAREAGSRTKMAVWSADENVDPIGACVGPRGQRVAAIVEELHGEKIDIIKYSEDPAEFIAAALAPSDVEEVRLADEGKVCRVIVPDDQLSLAIGKEGQNARLAARLTGYKIDIKPVSRADE